MKITKYMTGPLQVNTYFAYDEETNKGFIVDPGGYDSRITDEINAANVELEYIILTHGHGDHIGGVEQFKVDFPNAKVVAHELEREMLQDARINSSMEIFMRPITIEADKYVRDKESLNVGNMELTFLHTPGHTKGGMCISIDNVIFSGDTIFRYSIGRTDFYGGDFRTLINSIKDRLFYFPDDTVLLPGHMGASTIADEKRGNPFV
ncbi:MAG: MBL fold metallo-hydrolase [Firmicutes bacterium]|nr:MBL fold metallo-hydrolase [Bacillota bacterium]